MELEEQNTTSINPLEASTTTLSNQPSFQNDNNNDIKNLDSDVLEPKPLLTVVDGVRDETQTVDVTDTDLNDKNDGDEGEEDVIVRDKELTDANDASVMENDENGGDGEAETAKKEEEVTEEVKTVENVKDVETVEGDEAIEPDGVTGVDEEEPVVADEEKLLETDMESDEEKAGAESPEQRVKTRGRGGKKRKRGGKASQATPKVTGGGKKTVEEEDVCFICFDGGDLVLCDKRNCPKAYHPSCINREEAFFQTKGQWNCGWHLCSECSKKADYMCYTCTFSLCKSCIKTNVILCVKEKEKKGFCESCMNTVMLIEKNSQENQGNIDFNDQNSWEYLFKDYWTNMKANLGLSLSELVEAKNPYKGSKPAGKQELPAGHSDGDSGSENPAENLESETRKTRSSKSKKPKTRSSAANASDRTQWASKELLEFVTHMGKDTSYQSQFDVQALLLEYIKTNKLRDSRRKSQIICDARLQGLFGKPRVGHFEMLKLLESHFLIKEDDDNQGSVVDTDTSPIDDEKTKDKKRKNRKKGEQELQSNREDYAAIDIHNIHLIYIKRKLAEDLLDDTEAFHSKIVGTFVRIRISGANHNQDIYRLVQVTGTTTTGAHYAVGKKTTDIMLEILNLDKTESVSIDTISNQEFTEDECKRLRQSIKCGLINRLTVGDILDKAIELQATRVNDWLETEVVRLSHLRDRASDLGRKKELRECVEKLEVLKTPEERARRLQDIPVIHDDPTMDPNHESEDETSEDDKKQDMYNSSMGSRSSKRRDYPSKESWRGAGTSTSRNPGKSYEFSRNLSSNDFTKKVEDHATSPRMGLHNDNIRDQGRDRVVQPLPSALKNTGSASEAEKIVSSTKDGGATETEKIWHYKDPSGKIQGPFSMAQLRKWNNNKFFPVDLRIWRTSEKEKDGILLTDALEGRLAVKIEKHGFANLPSPTPNKSLGHVAPPVGPSSYQEGLQSPTPSGSQMATSLVASGNQEPNAMVHTLAGQNAYGWSGGPPQTHQPNQWAVQVPAGNFLQQPPQPNASWPAMPPNPNMGQVGPTTGNQPNQEPNAMVHTLASQNAYGWSGGPPQTYQPNQWAVQVPAGNFLQQPPQPNASWPAVPPNPNMGLVGPTTGNQPMNWGTVNVNSSLGLQAGPGTMNPGWVPPQPVLVVPPSQGWVGGPAPAPAPGTAAGPTQAPIVSVTGNLGEVASAGNLNHGWGSPRPMDAGRWDGSEAYNSRGGSSGFDSNRRHWDKQGSFNNRGR